MRARILAERAPHEREAAAHRQRVNKHLARLRAKAEAAAIFAREREMRRPPGGEPGGQMGVVVNQESGGGNRTAAVRNGSTARPARQVIRWRRSHLLGAAPLMAGRAVLGSPELKRNEEAGQ
jgi:hypothetical protein